MEAMKRFEETCRAFLDPSFYPHSVREIERRDTHISAVFLTGDWAYKLKKPVDFGFLDFSTLEKRLHCCRQEVLLNGRLSHGVYHSVETIRRDAAGRLCLGGDGDGVEVAVKMRQLPEEASLQALLSKSLREQISLDASLGRRASELGHLLAGFYLSSPRSASVDHFGDPDVVAFNVEENFQQIEPFAAHLLPLDRWDLVREVSRAFLKFWRPLFEKRIEEGRIHDGHGDLRPDHIYLLDPIQVIDCIEFNDRFRYGDAASDLSFLHMELERLGQSGLSRAILDAYVEAAKDFDLYALIDFYAAYRAVVKVKVACLRWSELDEGAERAVLQKEAEEYLSLAYRFALQFSRPTLWVCCGLPASGKSYLARALAEALSLVMVQSDRLRKEREGIAAAQPVIVGYDQGLYRLERRQYVYAAMLAIAQEELRRGRSVILDGSFSRRRWRDDARRLAIDCDTNLIFLECACEEGDIRERLIQREVTGGTSDARLQHLTKMIQEFEPTVELGLSEHVVVDTCRPFEHSMARVFSEGYACKCEQVRAVLQRL
ncbi:MAG: AAA family ATPase [Syntrophobacteraceae bacterium]